jgi:hypothetical protein
MWFFGFFGSTNLLTLKEALFSKRTNQSHEAKVGKTFEFGLRMTLN